LNASLQGNVRRAIDFHQGEKEDENDSFSSLIRSAVTLNASKTKEKSVPRGPA
jgi:hypothetical protein